MSDEVSDVELLERWRAGDRHAGHLLAKRHYAPLRRFLSGKINDDAAWVVAQQAFLALCEDLEQFKGFSSFRSYLFGIARWKLIEYLRQGQRHGKRFDPLLESVVDAKLDARLSSMFAFREREQIVAAAFRRLPLDHQLMLSLKTCQGLTHGEIGEVFAMTAAQVDGHVHRARERLRDIVDTMIRTPASRPGELNLNAPSFDLRTCLEEVLPKLGSESTRTKADPWPPDL